VASGGTTDTKTKKVTSTVTWNAGPLRNNSVALSEYFTNWSAAIPQTAKGGVLVYGDGGVATDSVLYKIFDANASTWSAPQSVADIDGATTNRSLRATKLYASATRNEKILLTRHSNNTNQYIYGQVFNGTTWSNVQLLSSWANNTFLDVQNFDGTYLANGDFLTMYSDNSTTPKFRVWNGSVWGSQISSQNVGGVPNYIITRTRPGTNEIMAVTFDQSSDTNSEYFNGGTYISGNWVLSSEHATQAPVNTKRIVDFEWSSGSSTKGLMTYSNNANDRSIRYKVFTANGSGGGTWGTVSNGANEGSAGTRLGVLRTITRPSSNEFLACSQNTVPQIICYRRDIAQTLTNPINQIIASVADAGIQKSFDIGYEQPGGTYAISVYSDNSITPRIKKYNPSNNTFDATTTDMTNLNGTLKTARIISQPTTNNIMILLADSNMRTYSQVWDGTNHALFSTANAWGFNTHGINGSAVVNYYYDFAWDNF
jgi:hypothetical protein